MKFEDLKKFLDIAKMGMDAVVSISDWRARRRIERRKALDPRCGSRAYVGGIGAVDCLDMMGGNCPTKKR